MSGKLVALLLLCEILTRHISEPHFTHEWGVCLDGGEERANAVALRHGFVNLGKIHTNCYHFIHPHVRKRSLDRNVQFHERLDSDPEVQWAKQQRVKRRIKRDFVVFQNHDWAPRSISKVHLYNWNDPRWPQMWYLNRGNGLDMNVQDAWAQGATGKGTVVTILDDGLEKDHPDIVKNYDPLASYDVNSHDEDPMPRYDLLDTNRHGTRCAGEVAAIANNSFCAVGVAYEANVGGVRMLDGDVTDAVEARSLSLNPQHIDIYSASWGPDDDGKTVDGPGELAVRAFVEGVTKGRQGKGSIFVWASGNGGRDNDNCNCDGYTNSIWTLSISSATESGMVPWYSEACSSTLATTYSSGASGEKQIVTTDLHHSCTASHTGTSASAPLAAGICALALHANRNLTWRDMQHIVVRTARPANLIASDWQVNGVGRNVSHSFGYGLMDAGAMVRLAKVWKTVPEQHKCEHVAPHVDKFIPAKSQVMLQLRVSECQGVNYLEHVQAKVSLSAGRRGDIQIYLTSPAGTRSTLLARRSHDNSRAGFQMWPFMTVHCWGENPLGTWTLEIHNEGHYTASLSDWNLIQHGVVTSPRPHGSEYEVNKPSLQQLGHGDGTLDDESPSNELQPTPLGNAAACSKVSDTGACLECTPGLFMLLSTCVESCPDRFYTIQTNDSAICAPCHYSCRNCVGANDYECLSCYDDAQLWNGSGLQRFCYPMALVNLVVTSNRWYVGLILAFIVNFAIIIGLVLYIVGSCARNNHAKYRIVEGSNHTPKFLDQVDFRFDSEED